MFSSWARRSLDPAPPGHHIAGLFGHRGGGLSAPLLDHLTGLLPGEALQASGEDESHSGKTIVNQFLFTAHIDPGVLQTPQQVSPDWGLSIHWRI